ncbi:hypothetical protein [Tahibacter amnicola]|uniref:Uncharacterized protein n=1 Tax=Tahibacter amnicola TaxID=2976241 RepID=A0ABY6BR81_9GAMM|nr:hypothetical protein [Tahibacter amnicola]UXI70272.1 hypothetical protein N4264_11745 [Tahibacter amnicola]
MNEPDQRPTGAPSRISAGIPETLVATATAVITLQVLVTIGGVFPRGNWYAGLFFFAGAISLFGAIGLIVLRRSVVWVVAAAISLLDWLVALVVLYGMGIARMH